MIFSHLKADRAGGYASLKSRAGAAPARPLIGLTLSSAETHVMANRIFLTFVLAIATGCTSSPPPPPASRVARPTVTRTGFEGRWETSGQVDTGPTIGTAKVRLELDPDGGEWRVYWTRPDGAPRAGMGGPTWALLDATTASLVGSGGGALRVELVDAHTLQCAVFERPVQFQRFK
jgi:hypothetical protein